MITCCQVLGNDVAIIQVQDYLMATSQLAQTTLRAVPGKHGLDEMLVERERLNMDIQKILDAQTDPWGIKVSNDRSTTIVFPVPVETIGRCWVTSGASPDRGWCAAQRHDSYQIVATQ